MLHTIRLTPVIRKRHRLLGNRALSGRVKRLNKPVKPSLFGELPPMPLVLTRAQRPAPRREPTLAQRIWVLALNYPLSMWTLVGSIVISGWFLYLGFKR